MTTIDSLNALLAPSYLNRAINATQARRWVEAEADLVRYSALMPQDYRAPLLRAKIRLHEGRIADCLIALEDARRLGHERTENDRMIGWLYDQDRRRLDRQVYREQVREYWRVQPLAVGGQVYLLCSRFWTRWSTHLLFASLIFVVWLLYWNLGQPL